MRKRSLSVLILMLTLCTYLFPLTACFPSYGIGYEINAGYVSVVSFEGPAIHVRIASSYEGYPVKHIGNGAFKRCYDIVSITIPSSVESIGAWAFEDCTSLKSITLPKGLRTLGGSAFDGCHKLTNIIIPDNVSSIGSFTFRNCFNLQTITIGEGVKSIDLRVFSQCGALARITFKDPTNWYNTTWKSEWNMKSGGIKIDLSNPEDNVSKFTTYQNYYWYKAD